MRIAFTAAILSLALVAPLAQRAAAEDDEPDVRQEIEQAISRANQAHEAKEYDKAIELYKAIEKKLADSKLPKEQQDNALQIVFYNEACAFARKGDADKAFERFERSLEAGYASFDEIDKDNDFDSIRGDPRYKALIAKYQERAKKAAAAHILSQISADALFPFDFDLTAYDEKPLKLAELRGKVVLVDVWGTWCGPCRREIPHLVELEKTLSPKGFEVVGLNVEREAREQALAKTKEFMGKNGMTYRCALADDAFTDKIPDFEGYPTLLFIDRSGKVRLKIVGYTEEAVLEAVAEKLLAEAAPPAGSPTPAPAPTPKKQEGGKQEF